LCFHGISGNPYEYKSVWCRRESAGVAEVPFQEPLNGAIGDSAGTVNRYGQRLAHAPCEFMLAERVELVPKDHGEASLLPGEFDIALGGSANYE